MQETFENEELDDDFKWGQIEYKKLPHEFVESCKQLKQNFLTDEPILPSTVLPIEMLNDTSFLSFQIPNSKLK